MFCQRNKFKIESSEVLFFVGTLYAYIPNFLISVFFL